MANRHIFSNTCNYLLMLLVSTATSCFGSENPIAGTYHAVTETEYGIDLELQANGNARMKLEVYGIDEDDNDWSDTWLGRWTKSNKQISIDFGKNGRMIYEVQQCLPFSEFGYDGCGYGLKPITTTTDPIHYLLRYGLWQADILPF